MYLNLTKSRFVIKNNPVTGNSLLAGNNIGQSLNAGLHDGVRQGIVGGVMGGIGGGIRSTRNGGGFFYRKVEVGAC